MIKIKCIKAKTDPSKGVFGLGAHDGEVIEGLTLNKVYIASAVNILSYGGSMSVSNELQFFIFNDNKKWKSYDTELFIPIE
jgi:hypothetical protein